MFNFKNKVFVVTGAGSGIGRELSIQLVEKGAMVAMVDLNKDSLMETMEYVDNSKVSTHILNVTDLQGITALPEEVIKFHGRVDGLINNAGIIQPFVNVNEINYDVIEKIINVNLYGTIYFTKVFLPHLLDKPSAYIANVSSMGGFIPFPGQTVYSASKAAVKIFTEGLYAELKSTNVNVSVVMPGAVATNIMVNSGLANESESEQNQDDSSKNAIPADQAASIIIKGMEREKLRILVGSDAKFLDVFYRISAKRAIDYIVKQMGKLVKSADQ